MQYQKNQGRKPDEEPLPRREKLAKQKEVCRYINWILDKKQKKTLVEKIVLQVDENAHIDHIFLSPTQA